MPGIDAFLLKVKYGIRRIVGSPSKWYGLETSNVMVEYVPLFIPTKENYRRLERVRKQDEPAVEIH